VSWPADGAPRFVVRSVTGYGVGDSFAIGRTRSLTSWMLLDRADIHRCLLEWQGSRRVPDQLAALLNDEATRAQGSRYLRKLRAGGKPYLSAVSCLSKLRARAAAL